MCGSLVHVVPYQPATMSAAPFNPSDGDGSRAAGFLRRIACWKDTVRLTDAEVGAAPPSTKVTYDPVYAWGALFDERGPSSAPPAVAVEDMDTIDAGLHYQQQGYNPAVLNLADDCFPGGCVDVGSGAQEESLFRRTNLHSTLSLRFYPLMDGEVVYSPGVAVIKTSERDGWSRYHAPLPRLAFIAGPAVKYPRCAAQPSDDGGARRLSHEDAERLRVKLRAVLQAAHKHGHDCVVLGAMGCGAWRNPPAHVAEVMRGVLEEEPRAFRRVVIAILGTAPDSIQTHLKRAQASNLEVFERAFGIVVVL